MAWLAMSLYARDHGHTIWQTPPWLSLLISAIGLLACATIMQMFLAPVHSATAASDMTFDERRAALIEEIKTSPTEICYLIAPDGRILSRGTGSTQRCALPMSREIAGSYLLHNHPSCTPISDADQAIMAKYGLAGVEAVCPDGRSFVQWRAP